MKFKIAFEWADFKSAADTSYSFPNRATAFMRRYAGPGVYRWAIYEGELLNAVYVGEAEDISRRLQHYLNPGKTQFTNIRVKELLEERLSAGMRVLFQFLQFPEFVINGHAFGCSHLSDPFARKVVENLAILEAFHFDCEVLNKGKNVIQKKVEAFSSQLAKLSRAERAKLIDRLTALSAAQDKSMQQ